MVFRFENAPEAACTLICLSSVVVVITATVLCYVAAVDTVPALIDLPANVDAALPAYFDFPKMQESLLDVKRAVELAMMDCSIMPAMNCSTAASPSDTQRQQAAPVVRAVWLLYNDTLASILKVASDQYFGIPYFQTLAAGLNATHHALTELQSLAQTDPTACGASVPHYCALKTTCMMLSRDEELQRIQAGLDIVTHKEGLQEFNEQAELLNILYALPALIWLALIFYAYFFFSNAKCSSASGAAYCACACHGLCWFIFFGCSLAIFTLGFLAMEYAEDEPLGEDVVVGGPTLNVLLEHVKREYPVVWEQVLKQPMKGAEEIYWSFVVFAVGILLLLLPTISSLCGLYYHEDPYATKNPEWEGGMGGL